ncbi:T9SS type A sorting domain-containing protein [bacterium]|nr:T9SS type A sorting domain-containing protein [bacterium]
MDVIAEEKVRVRLEMVESSPDFRADIYVESPVDLIGLEMIFSSKANTLSSVDFSLDNMLNPGQKFPDMDYSFNFIKNIGGLDLGKFIGYSALFSEQGRQSRENWPASDYRRVARINFGPNWKWDKLPPVSFSFLFHDGKKSLDYVLENKMDVKPEEPPPPPEKAYAYSLFQNYPNPFNVDGTKITYTLKERCLVKIDIYNSNGEHMRTLVNEEQDKGKHTIGWKPNKGSGVFFYKIVTPEYSQVKKMTSVK